VSELCGRHGEDAGAAADVEDAAWLRVEQQLEAEARRWVRARPERPPGVDEDGNRIARRLLPRRADPEWSDADRAVELAPAVFPAFLDLGRARAGERCEDAERRLAVGGELDFLPALVLLEPIRRQLEEARPELLELVAAGADRGTDQRKALLSLRMKPSSVSS
jgi:hypothetical protein